MFCPVCGNQYEGTPAFCKRCGRALRTAEAPPERQVQFRSIRSLGRVLAVAFCYVILFDLIAATIGILRVGVRMASPQLAPYREALTVVSVFQSIVFVVTAIIFLAWIYRAYRNLGPLGCRNLKYSAGWAVGWFFIPFANLFMPYKVSKEIWKASDPACTDGGSWHNARVSPLVPAWWVLYIVSSLVANLAQRAVTTADHGLGQALSIAVDWAWLASVVIKITAAVLAIFVVWGITTRQDEKRSGSRTTAPSTLPSPDAVPIA